MDSAVVAVASSIAQAAVKGGLAAVVKIGLTAPPVDEAPFIEPAEDGSDVEAFPDEEEEDASFP